MKLHSCRCVYLRWAAGLSCVIALMLAGCGGGAVDSFGTLPVKGRVTFDGQPVTGAAIMFAPIAASEAAGTKTGKPATGELDANGEFTLSTYEMGDGAVIGKHKVILSASDPAKPLPGELPPGFEVEIKAGQENHIDIPLMPLKGK